MSSSVFYESPSDSDCDGSGGKNSTNLVVVYKSNTVNVNKQDLQDLLLGMFSFFLYIKIFLV